MLISNARFIIVRHVNSANMLSVLTMCNVNLKNRVILAGLTKSLSGSEASGMAETRPGSEHLV